MTSVDLNADVGEGMDDALLLPFLTSANVACGFHAGDPQTMDATVERALALGVRWARIRDIRTGRTSAACP